MGFHSPGDHKGPRRWKLRVLRSFETGGGGGTLDSHDLGKFIHGIVGCHAKIFGTWLPQEYELASLVDHRGAAF